MRDQVPLVAVSTATHMIASLRATNRSVPVVLNLDAINDEIFVKMSEQHGPDTPYTVCAMRWATVNLSVRITLRMRADFKRASIKADVLSRLLMEELAALLAVPIVRLKYLDLCASDVGEGAAADKDQLIEVRLLFQPAVMDVESVSEARVQLLERSRVAQPGSVYDPVLPFVWYQEKGPLEMFVPSAASHANATTPQTLAHTPGDLDESSMNILSPSLPCFRSRSYRSFRAELAPRKYLEPCKVGLSWPVCPSPTDLARRLHELVADAQTNRDNPWHDARLMVLVTHVVAETETSAMLADAAGSEVPVAVAVATEVATGVVANDHLRTGALFFLFIISVFFCAFYPVCLYIYNIYIYIYIYIYDLFFCVIFSGSLPRLELPLLISPVVPTARDVHLAKLRAAIEMATAHLLQCRAATKDTMRQLSSAQVAALSLPTSPRGSKASAAVAPVAVPLLTKAEMRATLASVKEIEACAEKALRKAKLDLEKAVASNDVPDEDDMTGTFTTRAAGIYLNVPTCCLQC